ncbi:MAG TPA: hypothetical protein VGD40_05745 [Chryseosolibacter sp.]
MIKSIKIKHTITLLAIVIGINTHGQDKERGFNLGFVYPLSIQGIHSKEYTNVFSLHALLGISRGERAFTVAGFGNMVIEDAHGFQVAGFYNMIGGNATGFKAAGFMNSYRDAIGFQAAGFANFSKGNIRGMQGAGFMNIARGTEGFQAAGFMNKADSLHGVQAAGFINIAEDVDGAQVAGYINIARNVKGVQVSGFINIADSSEYPIAPINIIRNGEMYLGVTTDDNLSTILTFRSGSKKLYGIVGAGYNFKNDNEVIVVQYGMGANFFTRENFRLKTEGTITHMYGQGRGNVSKTSVSALPTLRLGHNVEIFGGPSLNFAVTTSEYESDMVDHYLWRHTSYRNGYTLHGMYVGYMAGIHVKL